MAFPHVFFFLFLRVFLVFYCNRFLPTHTRHTRASSLLTKTLLPTFPSQPNARPHHPNQRHLNPPLRISRRTGPSPQNQPKNQPITSPQPWSGGTSSTEPYPAPNPLTSLTESRVPSNDAADSSTTTYREDLITGGVVASERALLLLLFLSDVLTAADD
ncbi:hypothetical protein IWZ01DRAFT_483220 [Phyllosticta capitalensis]